MAASNDKSTAYQSKEELKATFGEDIWVIKY